MTECSDLEHNYRILSGKFANRKTYHQFYCVHCLTVAWRQSEEIPESLLARSDS